MKNYIIKKWPLPVFLFLIFTVVGIVAAQQIPPPRPPANVPGNWTVYTKGPTGRTETKSIQLKQNGTTITGHFKGPTGREDWREPSTSNTLFFAPSRAFRWSIAAGSKATQSREHSTCGLAPGNGKPSGRIDEAMKEQ